MPTVLTDTGTLVWDSLAIAEEWAARRPGAGMWSARAKDRDRGLAAEMHSGFAVLRRDCPMDLCGLSR